MKIHQAGRPLQDSQLQWIPGYWYFLPRPQFFTAFDYVISTFIFGHKFLRDSIFCYLFKIFLVWSPKVRTGPGKPGKSWNFVVAFSRIGPGKFWKSVQRK